MKIQFNTGRGYSPEGQRIVAVREHGGPDRCDYIRFRDIDRGICGRIPINPHLRSLDAYEMQQLIMTNYDHGNYEGAVGGDLQWED